MNEIQTVVAFDRLLWVVSGAFVGFSLYWLVSLIRQRAWALGYEELTISLPKGDLALILWYTSPTGFEFRTYSESWSGMSTKAWAVKFLWFQVEWSFSHRQEA